MDWSVLRFGAGTPVPYPSNPVDIEVLLLELCHAKNYIVVGNISNDKVNCMAPLRSSAIAHLYHLL